MLVELLRGLPQDIPAPVLVCQHTPQHGASNLPKILGRASSLPVSWATDGVPLLAGRVYVAPPGHHLMADDGRGRLSTGPRVNRHRPSVDVLFASVAKAAGPAATVMVLSGVLDDGAVGAALVEREGGQVFVQDPGKAQFASMPAATLRAAQSATVLGGDGSDELVRALRTASTRKESAAMTSDLIDASAAERRPARDFLEPGESRLVRLACPDCGGALAQVDLPRISYFRCHIGHQYGPDTLVAAMSETSETRLWSAVAALEEEAMLRAYLEEHPEGARLIGNGDAEQLWARAGILRGHAQRWTGGLREREESPTVHAPFDESS